MAVAIDVEEIVERQTASRFRASLLIWMSITMLVEGFDNQVQAYTAPAIIKAWHIAPASFGIVIVAFQCGFMLGVASLGNLGDIVGRRAMIVIGVVCFGVLTLVGASMTTIGTLAASRFCAAIFLGGAIPNALALAIEYAPRHRRAVRVGWMYVWYSSGAAIGGLISARLIPDRGWQSIYVLGGACAVALSAGLLIFLPESARFLARRGKDPERLARLLRRLSPEATIPDDAVFVTPPRPQRAASVVELFRGDWKFKTLPLWAACLASMVGLQFLTNWMPTIFTQSKVDYSYSLVALGAFQAAGALGGLVAGWQLDKKNGVRRLALLAFVGAPVVACFSTVIGDKVLLLALVSAAGFCVVGAQSGLNALGGVLYPTEIRSTGSGWAYGAGRIGAVSGPILGSIVLAAHLDLTRIFLIVAVPPLCVGAALSVLVKLRPNAVSETAAAPSAPTPASRAIDAAR